VIRFKLFSIILCLCFVLICLAGCETIKGGARGFLSDYENTKENIGQVYENTGKAIKKIFQGTRKAVKTVCQKTGEAIDKGYEKVKKADEWIQENLW
jgi:hypothetical protein